MAKKISKTARERGGAILFRDLDPDFVLAFREACKHDGRTQRWVVVELINHYMAYGMPEPPKGGR